MFEIAASMEQQWLLMESREVLGGYEEQMLLHNHMEGILPMEIIVRAGKKQYRYQVTGCRNLAEILAGKKVNGEMMQALFSEMFSVVMSGKRYLLQEDNYFITPESIFFREGDRKLFLCYVPGYQKPLLEQMQGLSEWILEHLDVQDSQAVYQGYAMHVLCREGKTSFQELLNLFVSSAPSLPSEVFLQDEPERPDAAAEVFEVGTEVRKKREITWQLLGKYFMQGLLLLAAIGVLIYMLP